MKRIKKVIRRNFPETNSSSSHSVVICTNKDSLIHFQEDGSLHVGKDGTLIIPERGENFGWEYERYNDVLHKLWYVCGIIFNYRESGVGKEKKLLIDILKKYTGAKKVLFEWEEKRKKHPENYDDYYTGAPEIDHNSSDIFPEIVESRDSIKNFIFNKKSWLFLGNDNSSAPDEFYDVDNEYDNKPEAIASVEFSGKIGRVDIEIPKFPGEDILKIMVNDIRIRNMYFDNSPGVKEWKFGNETAWSGFKIDLESIINNIFMINENISSIDKKTGNPKIVWTSDKLLDLIVSELGIKSHYQINYNDPEQKEKIDEVMNKNKNLWKSIPVTIITTEFGKL